MLLDLVAASMVEIVKAEAREASLWQKADVTPEEYFEVIKLKGGVAELHCKIGGINQWRRRRNHRRFGALW